MPDTLAEILRNQRRAFETAGVESPALSAELLLAEALGLDRQALLHRLILEPEAPCSSEQSEKFLAFSARRLQGEPVAYILGRKEFYSREFLVNRHTLIPRPETELIVDCALDWAKSGQRRDNKSAFRFADLGAGSGCLAVTLALELSGLKDLATDISGLALDISAPALDTARENASRLGAAESLEFLLADFTRTKLEDNSLDLLVSNPPYVSWAEYAGLDKGVREFEPEAALVPPEPDHTPRPESNPAEVTPGRPPIPPGAALLAPLCRLAAAALKPGGMFLMEIGCGQGAYVRDLLENNPAWSEAAVLRDLAGLDRTLRALKA